MENLEKSYESNQSPNILEQIRKHSQLHNFSCPERKEFTNISSSEYWAPVSVTAMSYLPSYKILPDEVKLRYNQYAALAVNELFCLFEMKMLVPIIRRCLQTRNLPADLKLILQNFIHEETKHAEMFWRLNETARPDLYPKRDYFFLKKSSWLMASGLKMLARWPEHFIFWVWIAIFFEERTLVYAKEYFKSTGEEKIISKEFILAHRNHFLEEVRHVQTDSVLVSYFYKNASSWKKKVSGKITKFILKGFTSPRRMPLSILSQLECDFPEIDASVWLKLRQELPLLKNNFEYQQMHFSDKAAGRTWKLMAQFNEMAPCLSFRVL